MPLHQEQYLELQLEGEEQQDVVGTPLCRVPDWAAPPLWARTPAGHLPSVWTLRVHPT